jgi:hypothetical protein
LDFAGATSANNLFVDLAPMPDVVKINLALIEIELVQNPIIANAQLAFRATAQPLMRVRSQPEAHFVYLPFRSLTNTGWQ